MKSYITVAPAGGYHDWAAKRDSRLADAHVVLEWSAWGAWYDLVATVGSKPLTAAKEREAWAALPEPVSVHATYAEANAERDRLNGALADRRTKRALKALST